MAKIITLYRTALLAHKMIDEARPERDKCISLIHQFNEGQHFCLTKKEVDTYSVVNE